MGIASISTGKSASHQEIKHWRDARLYQDLDVDLLLQDGFRVTEAVMNNPGYKRLRR